MKTYIYLAPPYSHSDPFVREARYLWAMKELGDLLKQGFCVYSPIVHCHELAKIDSLPKEAAFWESYNFRMLAKTDVLWVLMLPGWKESLGVTAEITEALRLLIPVMQVEPKGTLI